MLGEKKKAQDSNFTGASIARHELVDDVVFYLIDVRTPNKSWVVAKRFSQFEEMYNNLLVEYEFKPLPKGLAMPPKKPKMWYSHTSAAFIEERRVLLDNMVKKLVSSKETAKSLTVLEFLSTDVRDVPLAEEKEVAEMPEDVEITGVTVPSTRLMSDHVLYQVDVTNSRKRKSFSKWTVLKRYVQFYEMDTAFRQQYVTEPEFLESLPPLPERRTKLLYDHMDADFVEERRVLLESYLQKMILIERVVRDPIFLHFLGVNV